MSSTRRYAHALAAASILVGAACAGSNGARTVAGDWDAYVASGSTPLAGFEGWRRQAFAHFAGRDSAFVGAIRRRTGEPMLEVTSIAEHGDSITLNGTRGQSLAAAWRGDTLLGVMMADG